MVRARAGRGGSCLRLPSFSVFVILFAGVPARFHTKLRLELCPYLVSQNTLGLLPFLAQMFPLGAFLPSVLP